MNKPRILLFAPLALALSLFPGCVSSTNVNAGAVTSKQETIANAVEDILAVGLVPVLVNNPDYLAEAASVSVALGTIEGAELTAASVETFLARTRLKPEDARTVAALVTAAWDTYQRRYAQQVGVTIRPDVKLFLGAVRNGIARAVASIPPGNS